MSMTKDQQGSMWIVLKMFATVEVEVKAPHHLDPRESWWEKVSIANAESGMIGALPVYGSREEALVNAGPGDKILEAKLATPISEEAK